MTIFAYPDHVVDVNIIEQTSTFNLSYIQRVLFIVTDSDLAAGTINYVTDVESSTSLPTAGDYVTQYYFYKENVKSCDVLFIATDIFDLDSILTQEQKDTINDRTFTCSLDLRVGTPDVLTYTFFKGITQWSSNVFLDTTNLNRQTVLLNKTNTPEINNENKELARFASWFVNRDNFFNTVGNKALDYIYNDSEYFDVLTKEDLDLARQNNMTYFSAFNGISYCAGYNAGQYFQIIPYYEEQIRRAVQQNLFLFITGSPQPFYNQINVNLAYTIALNTVLVYSKPPFGFVNPQATFVKRTKFSDIPASDIKDGILRINMEVDFYSVIRQIKVDIQTTVGLNEVA